MKKIRTKWKVFPLVIMSFFMGSCLDTDLINPDLIDTDNVVVSPEFVLPIAKLNITLGDLLENNLKDQVLVEEEGRYVIKKNISNLASFKIKDFVDFKQTTAPISTSIPSLPSFITTLDNQASTSGGNAGEELLVGAVSGVISVDPGAGSSLTLRSLVSSFNLALGLPPIGFTYRLEIELGTIGSFIRKSVTVPKNSTIPDFVFSKTDKLTFNITNRNKLDIKAKLFLIRTVNEKVEITGLTSIPFSMQIKNLDMFKAVGNFGSLSIPIPSDKVNMDMGEMNEISGFNFASPKIALTFENHNVGLGFALNFNFVASKPDASSLALTKNEVSPFKLYGPTDELISGKFIVDKSIGFTKDNSNITAFMNFFPFNEIAYSGNISLINNINAPDFFSNFVSSDAELKVSADVVLPLEFSTNGGLNYTYHLENQDLGISADDVKKIISAKLIFKARNGWPLSVNFNNISFKDENGLELASIKGNLLTAPTIKADGTAELNTAYVVNYLEISSDVIKILDRVKNIDFDIVAAVGSSTGVAGKFTSKEKLELIIGVQTKLELGN